MENRKDYQMEEDIVDLKELLLYVLRKWRILIIAGLVGVVLGVGLQMIKPEKTVEDMNIGSLHLKEIEQYDRYQKYYAQLLEKEAASVYLNMDPMQVYSGQKAYYISAYKSDLDRIGEEYRAILLDSQIYQELAQLSGLDCTEREIRELVSVEFSRYDASNMELVLEEETDKKKVAFSAGKIDLTFDEMKGNGKVTISINVPTMEARDGMMKYLDARVSEVNERFAANLKEFACEPIAEISKFGYDEGIEKAREDSLKVLVDYEEEIENLKSKLTEDDLLYYSSANSSGVAKKSVSDLIKWGIIVGVLFGGLMVVFYGVRFLFDGCVKTVDELKQRYSLSLIAVMAAVKGKKNRCVIDRLLETKYEYNTDQYLRASLEVMKESRIQICGDMKNAEIAEKLNLFSDNEAVVVCDRFAVDEYAQRAISETDGAVLIVQLWKTKHAELLRELETCDRLGQKVLGIVVIA